MVWLDQEKFIHPIMSVQATASGPSQRRIVKTWTAKTLTAAVVVGGTLFATGGTSFAVGTLPPGAAVTATGTGPTVEAAEGEATKRAADQCESPVVTSGSYDNYLANGTWTSTYTGRCGFDPPYRVGDLR